MPAKFWILGGAYLWLLCLSGIYVTAKLQGK